MRFYAGEDLKKWEYSSTDGGTANFGNKYVNFSGKWEKINLKIQQF